MMTKGLHDITLENLQPVKTGKVRSIYDMGDKYLFVATDRVSAYDVVLPTPIPDKGRVLTQISKFWFLKLADIASNHFYTDDILEACPELEPYKEQLNGRSMLVKKAEVVPVECVVRGYITGSGWKEYQQNSAVCGISLPAGLQESDKLSELIFTPATKADEGHDINISFEEMCDRIGSSLSERLRDLSIDIYRRGAEYALTKGIIIADTKFEFGICNDELLLIDEVLTPDSSRFWPVEQYQPGQGQPSFDKQFVRDWLVSANWDRNSPPPPLPDDIVNQTRNKYIEAYEILSESEFEWK